MYASALDAASLHSLSSSHSQVFLSRSCDDRIKTVHDPLSFFPRPTFRNVSTWGEQPCSFNPFLSFNLPVLVFFSLLLPLTSFSSPYLFFPLHLLLMLSPHILGFRPGGEISVPCQTSAYRSEQFSGNSDHFIEVAPSERTWAGGNISDTQWNALTLQVNEILKASYAGYWPHVEQFLKAPSYRGNGEEKTLNITSKPLK